MWLEPRHHIERAEYQYKLAPNWEYLPDVMWGKVPKVRWKMAADAGPGRVRFA